MRLLHEGALRDVVSSGESLPAFLDYLTQLRSERDAAILYCYLHRLEIAEVQHLPEEFPMRLLGR